MILKKHEWISEIDGKPITSHAYYFSPEEQTYFHETLKGCEEQKVKAFMREIEIYLDYTQRILDHLNSKNRAAHRDKLFRLKTHYQAVYKNVLEIRSGRFQILPPRQCDPSEWNFQDTKNTKVKVRREIAFAAAILSTPEYLQKIMENLETALEIEKVKRGGGRKADEFGLALQIAKSFKRNIGIPRPWSGPFPNIIIYCFDIIGIKGNDRTRAIRQAIKNCFTLNSPK